MPAEGFEPEYGPYGVGGPIRREDYAAEGVVDAPMPRSTKYGPPGLGFNYELARADVLAAAREGRATYLPAGGRDNKTALVFIDGLLIGQASTVAQYVRTASDAPRFGESALLPGYDWQIPARLREGQTR